MKKTHNAFILLRAVILLFLAFSLNVINYSQGICQQTEVHGRVIDEQGKAVAGASVLLKEKNNVGTITDDNGNFKIPVAPNQRIIFSYVGYNTQEILFKGETSLLVKLQLVDSSLNDVVVIGYGTVKKKDQTGSIVSIKGSDLVKTNALSINDLLAGKVAGAVFQTRSAQPGGGVSVTIRGGLSPNGSNYPLYVIDGTPLTSNYSLNPSLNGLGYGGGIDQDPLVTLNPNDIESITVLKDASAIAIYGSNAANGVVLITTKKGSEGKVKVNYDGYYSLQTPKKFLDLLGAKEFMQLNNLWGHELWLVNNNITPYGNTDSTTVSPYIPNFSQQQITEAGRGTNWLDVVMNGTGYTTGHNLSLSGGSKNTQVYSSFNYTNNEGILKHSNLERYSGRFNITQKIGNLITFKSNLQLSQVKSTNASTGSSSGGGEMWPMLLTAIYFPPTIGIYDNNGNFNKGYYANMYNPAAYLIMTDNSVTNRFMYAPQLDVKIIPGLTATVVGGIDMQSATRKYFLPVAAQSFMNPNGQGQISQASSNNYDIEGYLNYSKQIKQSRITALLGAGYYNSNGDNFNMIGYGFFTDDFGVDNIGIASNQAKNSFGSGKWAWNKLSQFARVDYSFKDRYIVTVTARRDGASVFAENKKWGVFPGASLAWRMNEEPWLRSTKWLSNLKIRVGYGSVGNASILGNNALSLYQMVQGGYPYVIGGTTYYGIIQTQIGNPNLGWETDKTLNAGLDFGFWNERLTGSIDVFSRTAKNLLDWESLPSVNPVTSIAANIGSTRSNGFEILLNSKNITNKNFNWSTSLTLSTYKAFWLDRNPLVSLPSYIGKHDPIHAIYGWKTDGVIQSVSEIPSYMPYAKLGNMKYIDKNHDGKLDINDVYYLGNSDPKWNFGFENMFTYKQFDLRIYFYGLIGMPLWNGYASYANPANLDGLQTTNADIQVRNAWSTFNPKGNQPGIAPNSYSGNNPTGTTDFNMSKTGFVRLHNITIGYNMKGLNENMTVKGLRVYVNFQNVFLITKYKGIDPEMGTSYDPYPTVFSTSFGVNVTF